MINKGDALIVTKPYASRPAAIAWRIVAAWAARRWWVFAIPVVAALIGGMYDWRWLVALVFAVVVVIPAVLALAYYYHALSPEAARATIPHTLTLGDDALTVTFIPDEGQWHPDDFTVHYADLRNVETNGSSLVLWLNGKGYRHLEVPRSAFDSEDDFAKVSDTLSAFGTKFVTEEL